MKRKMLLFLALVAMLTALLAVAVSADTIYVDKDGEELFRYQIFDGTEENYKDYLSGLIKSYQGEFPKPMQTATRLAGTLLRPRAKTATL